MNRARRRLTSVIEQILMSERRIPYNVTIIIWSFGIIPVYVYMYISNRWKSQTDSIIKLI